MPNFVKLITTAASSKPVYKLFNTTVLDVSDAFYPNLGRNMYLTLAGTWEGEIRLVRSVDGGATWNRITRDGGIPTMIFSTNCDEIVQVPTDAGGIYRLEGMLTSGSASARLSQ